MQDVFTWGRVAATHGRPQARRSSLTSQTVTWFSKSATAKPAELPLAGAAG